jgi:hypothetical protein
MNFHVSIIPEQSQIALITRRAEVEQGELAIETENISSSTIAHKEEGPPGIEMHFHVSIIPEQSQIALITRRAEVEQGEPGVETEDFPSSTINNNYISKKAFRHHAPP